MKKIIFAFSCVFLMSGAAVADGRYEIVALNGINTYLIVDHKQERTKFCERSSCGEWQSWYVN